MTAVVPPSRRGACPALTAPMATGDGLLVRLVPVDGALSPEALVGLCDAALAFGNGILEVTARGSLQLRGLRAETVGPLNDAVNRLGIAAREGVPLDVSPLAGLEAGAASDARRLAAEIRAAISGFAVRLGPKVSVVIDDGGAISLAALKADIRLTRWIAEADAASPLGASGGAPNEIAPPAETSEPARWAIALAGDAATARALGSLPEGRLVAVVADLLEQLAQLGPTARMTDVLRTTDLQTLRHQRAMAPPNGEETAPQSAPAISATPSSKTAPATALPPSEPHPAPAPIASFPLADGTVALGIGLPFGHGDAATLKTLVAAAQAAGARDLRPAPGRVLLATHLTPTGAAELRAAAAALGFLTEADDPRRFVAACAGAPACASAHIPARTLAPEVAATLAPILDGSLEVHVSGCPKGCAHPATAALTLVGVAPDAMDKTVALVREGKAGDATQPIQTVAALLPTLARFAAALAAARRPGETSAEALTRLSPPDAPGPALLEFAVLESAP
ncbi:precorrin-3B synthase [Azorhizobium sp. AG788]|uniref:precorrin-3B synthase n=1 Tax=Azorhizobium sp. AG788 TaxID=2183897 RepID=UPI003138D152